MINKKLNYDTELLVITMEECGEMIEACSKAIREEEFVDNERMIEEVGDVLVMIDLIKKRGLLKSKDLESRMKVKKESQELQDQNMEKHLLNYDEIKEGEK